MLWHITWIEPRTFFYEGKKLEHFSSTYTSKARQRHLKKKFGRSPLLFWNEIMRIFGKNRFKGLTIAQLLIFGLVLRSWTIQSPDGLMFCKFNIISSRALEKFLRALMNTVKITKTRPRSLKQYQVGNLKK